MVESKQRLAKRARIYDAQERASDHGIGHPGGPTGWRKPRAPSATGNAARLRRLRKGYPELHAQVMAGELTPYKAATMAVLTPQKQSQSLTARSRRSRKWNCGWAARPAAARLSAMTSSVATRGSSIATASWDIGPVTGIDPSRGGSMKAPFLGQASALRARRCGQLGSWAQQKRAH
jgi:hypothetical protein